MSEVCTQSIFGEFRAWHKLQGAEYEYASHRAGFDAGRAYKSRNGGDECRVLKPIPQ